ncbi:MAG: efflux RND transporter permease subunit [Pseudomonadota bacterium]
MPTPDTSSGAYGGILSWFARHPTAANLLMVVLVIAGLAATPRMQAQFFPDVAIDNVTVSVIWDGASAEDVDRGIVQLMSPALREVEGVRETLAVSRENSASITLDFEPDWDIGRAADDVQAAVDALTELPEDADEPKVARATWRDRVTDIVITGTTDLAQIGLYADELINRLYDAGVTRAAMRGFADPQLTVEVPSAALIEHDISLIDVATLISEEVDADPAGDVTGSATRVRVGTGKRSVEEVRGLILRSTPEDGTLRLGDIAFVRAEGPDSGRAYLEGDNPAVVIRVDRSAEGDALDIQATVETVVADLRSSLPEGMSVDLVRTRSELITSRLNVLIDNAVIGLSLVLALLFLFLNARTAFWVAAGIPVALLTGLAVMYAAGLTINMISLFAMIITIGIVVDDAIIVGEHADARARKLREAPVIAAERAARRMALPVFCATLTTVIAFYGLTLIGGDFGKLIFDIPLTVIALLTASLIECFLILPNHMSKALVHQAKDRWYDRPSRAVNHGFVWLRERAFRPLMRLVVRARYPVLAAAVALLASQTALLITRDVPWRFFNAPESGSVTGNFAMAAGASRQDTLDMVRELQRVTEEVAQDFAYRHGVEPLKFVLAELGGNSGGGISGDTTRDPDQLGAISIELIDADLRPFSSFEFAAALRDRVNRHPLVEELSFRGWRNGPGEAALSVDFFGAPPETLLAAAETLQDALYRFPEVTGVEDNLSYDKDELILDLTPQGQALGFTIDRLARDLRARINGIEAASFPDGQRTAEIRVSLPEEELTADFLERIQIRAPAGSFVPLADVVRVQTRTGFAEVRRENGVRVVTVTGDIDQSNASRAAGISESLSTTTLPQIADEFQVNWRLSGLAEQEREFLADARVGFAFTVVGIYLVLTLVFSSWTRPLIVMAVIPFGLTGTVWGHDIWDLPMSMFTIVGLLGMTGIIINDSIVLVTTIDEHAGDRAMQSAIVEGAVDRLRPVFLTTLTTVAGLAPLLFEQSVQAQFMKPTVITLVYGLGFGMILVLLVVPALMAIQHDLSRYRTSLLHAFKASDLRMRRTIRSCAAVMIVWFAATLGSYAIFGRALPFIHGSAGIIDGDAGPGAALVLFWVGSLVIVAFCYGVAALSQRHARQPARQP